MGGCGCGSAKSTDKCSSTQVKENQNDSKESSSEKKDK